MIRVLIAIAVIFAAVVGLDRLGTVPVQVAVEWPGGAMAPSLRMVVVALAVFAVLAVVGWKLLSGVWHTPGAIRGFFRARRRDRGYAALSRGMIAVGSGDVRLAHRYAGEAGRLLSREPLVLLLEAQTAQIEGRGEDARAAFTRMLEDPETKLLGLRGLFIEASRAGDTAAARRCAAEAQKISPGLPWAGRAMMEYQSAEQDWAGALATLDASAAARQLPKPEVKRLRAVLLTARALEAEDAEPDRSRAWALEAHRLAPDFVPAAVVAARVLTRQQETRKAAKVVETTWRIEPHPELAAVYLHVRTGDSARDRLKRARMLESLKPHHVEGALAVARAALDARDFDLARAELAKALRQSPTQRVCLTMAELEEAETGDTGRVREWLARAVRAPRDAVWTADGVVSESWQPVSPVTGRLDAFEWRVPVSVESGATELDGSELAEQATRPLPTPRAAPVADLPVVDDEPAPPPPPAAAKEPPAAPPSPAAGRAEEPSVPASAAAAAAEPVRAEPARAEPPRPSAKPAPAFVEFPLAAAPDDPGPGRRERATTTDRAFI